MKRTLPLTIVRFDETAIARFGGFKEAISALLNAKRKNKRNQKDAGYKGDTDQPLSGQFAGISDQFWLWVFGYSSHKLPIWADRLSGFVPGSAERFSIGSIGSFLFNGILGVQIGHKYYGVLFGYSYCVFSSLLEKGFGIRMAQKMFSLYSVQRVNSKFIGAMTDKKSTSYYEPSLYLPDYGETVSQISGTITPFGSAESVESGVDLLQNCEKQANATFNSFSLALQYVSPDLSVFHRILACLDNIDQFCTTNQCDIPVLQFVKDKKKADYLSEKYLKFLLAVDQNPIFSISAASVKKLLGIETVGEDTEEVVLGGSKKGPFSESVLYADHRELLNFIKTNCTTAKSIKDISIFEQTKNGSEWCGDLQAILEGDFEDDDQSYVLYHGFWATYNQEFQNCLSYKIKKCWDDTKQFGGENYPYSVSKVSEFLNDDKNRADFLSVFRLSAFPEGPHSSYSESKLNYFLAKTNSGLGLFDRTKIPDVNENIEPCDLYDQSTETLIHVKCGDSGKLTEALQQSLFSARVLCGHNVEIKSRFGPNFSGQAKRIEVLFYCSGERKINILESKSFALRLAYSEWFSVLNDLKYQPLLTILMEEK